MLTCILYIFSTQLNHQDMQRFIPFTWAFSTQKAEDLVTKKHRSNNKERLPPSRTNIAPEQNRPSPKGKLQRNNLQHLCFEGVFSFLKKKQNLQQLKLSEVPPPQKKNRNYGYLLVYQESLNPWALDQSPKFGVSGSCTSPLFTYVMLMAWKLDDSQNRIWPCFTYRYRFI